MTVGVCTAAAPAQGGVGVLTEVRLLKNHKTFGAQAIDAVLSSETFLGKEAKSSACCIITIIIKMLSSQGYVCVEQV